MGVESKVLRTAIIEDKENELKNICAVLDEFAKNKGIQIYKTCYTLATDFLDNYSSNFDIVFMDIQLPDLDGMSAAKSLRQIDKTVILVFVTNFAQFAINGYEVDATDFIVKPVQYTQFALKMERILKRLSSISDIIIPVKTSAGMVSLSSSSIKYIEVLGHKLTFHTVYGTYESYGALSRIEDRLKEVHFVRCNNCYLVNPRYVEKINNETTVVGGDELKISYGKRKQYREAIAKYLGDLI